LYPYGFSWVDADKTRPTTVLWDSYELSFNIFVHAFAPLSAVLSVEITGEPIGVWENGLNRTVPSAPPLFWSSGSTWAMTRNYSFLVESTEDALYVASRKVEEDGRLPFKALTPFTNLAISRIKSNIRFGFSFIAMLCLCFIAEEKKLP
jgi:hypothetical protein